MGHARMRYDAGFRWGMGVATIKIVLSLVGAAAIGFCVFVLLEAVIPAGAHTGNPGAVLFRFQLSSMIAMGVFAGFAIVIYVRLSRSLLNGEPEKSRAEQSRHRLRKK
jgi:hypothetical protein